MHVHTIPIVNAYTNHISGLTGCALKTLLSKVWSSKREQPLSYLYGNSTETLKYGKNQMHLNLRGRLKLYFQWFSSSVGMLLWYVYLSFSPLQVKTKYLF